MKFRIACLLGGHRRLRRSVWWDGYDYRAICGRCGADLYKRGNVRWRRVTRARRQLLLTYQADRDR